MKHPHEKKYVTGCQSVNEHAPYKEFVKFSRKKIMHILNFETKRLLKLEFKFDSIPLPRPNSLSSRNLICRQPITFHIDDNRTKISTEIET